MHKNKIWLIFLTLMTSAVLWFTWGTLSQLADYFSYNIKTSPQHVQWSVICLNDSECQLKADYSFTYQNQKFFGKTVVTKPIYPNPWAAEHAATLNNTKPWYVWFSKKNPESSTVIKQFPMKQLISSIILWGLLIYFIWLGVYVTQFRR